MNLASEARETFNQTPIHACILIGKNDHHRQASFDHDHRTGIAASAGISSNSYTRECADKARASKQCIGAKQLP
jgi:hypothetical protein